MESLEQSQNNLSESTESHEDFFELSAGSQQQIGFMDAPRFTDIVRHSYSLKGLINAREAIGLVQTELNEIFQIPEAAAEL
jgi:hypothetical protein